MDSSQNHPQLGRQDDPNAPMIAGRGTKIIVSARGAYETRNLDGLFAALDDNQRVLFRQSIVRNLLDFVRPEIEQFAAPFPDLETDLRALDQWLSSPAQVTAEPPEFTRLIPWYDPFDRMARLIENLRRAAMESGCDAIEEAVTEFNHLPPLTAQAVRLIKDRITEGWMFEVAWTILHGRNVPPLVIDVPRIEALAKDVEHWYRKKDIWVLLNMLDEAQKAQFVQALRHQVIWHANTVPDDRWREDLLPIIRLARGWFADPMTLTEAALESAEQSLILEIEPNFSMFKSNPLRFMLGVFRYGTNPYSSPAVEQAVVFIDYVRFLLEGGPRRNPNSQKLIRARQWQLDTAYAILTDQPIPPLGNPNAD